MYQELTMARVLFSSKYKRTKKSLYTATVFEQLLQIHLNLQWDKN